MPLAGNVQRFVVETDIWMQMRRRTKNSEADNNTTDGEDEGGRRRRATEVEGRPSKASIEGASTAEVVANHLK